VRSNGRTRYSVPSHKIESGDYGDEVPPTGTRVSQSLERSFRCLQHNRWDVVLSRDFLVRVIL
jgi:hypothetical protein